MKRSIEERRASALAQLKNASWENSRAKRTGSQTREEWEKAKEERITHLEELTHGRKPS